MNPKNPYNSVHSFSLDSPEVFWGRLAKSRLQWEQDFTKVHDCNLGEGKFSWFLEGKLNAAGKSQLFLFVSAYLTVVRCICTHKLLYSWLRELWGQFLEYDLKRLRKN
jgi:hypothetical protein